MRYRCPGYTGRRFFPSGQEPVVHRYQSLLIGSGVRGSDYVISLALQLTLADFFIVLISPVLIDNIGWRTYIVFMCLLASFCPIIYFFYPETSNLGLEEIDLIFLPESMGGLNGNARIRMTPEMAATSLRRRSIGEKPEGPQVFEGA